MPQPHITALAMLIDRLPCTSSIGCVRMPQFGASETAGPLRRKASLVWICSISASKKKPTRKIPKTRRRRGMLPRLAATYCTVPSMLRPDIAKNLPFNALDGIRPRGALTLPAAPHRTGSVLSYHVWQQRTDRPKRRPTDARRTDGQVCGWVVAPFRMCVCARARRDETRRDETDRRASMLALSGCLSRLAVVLCYVMLCCAVLCCAARRTATRCLLC